MTNLATSRVDAVVFDALESFGADRSEISPDALLKDLDVDSLDLVELTQIVEEELGLRIAPEEFRGVTTVGEALAVVHRFAR